MRAHTSTKRHDKIRPNPVRTTHDDVVHSPTQGCFATGPVIEAQVAKVENELSVLRTAVAGCEGMLRQLDDALEHVVGMFECMRRSATLGVPPYGED